MSKAGWDKFVDWAKRFGQFVESDEQAYKLRLIDELRVAQAAVVGNDAGWADKLTSALKSKNNNLMNWRVRDYFTSWLHDDEEGVRKALLALWSSGGELHEKTSDFLALVPNERLPTPGGRICISSVLLLATFGENGAPFRPSAFKRAYALTGFDAGKPATEAERYRIAVEFLDQLRSEAKARGLETENRLWAQGLVWCVTKWKPPAEWSQDLQNELRSYRGQELEEDDEADDHSLPFNDITRADVIGAIEDFEAGAKHGFGPSTHYDLVHEGKRYPPKAIRSRGAKIGWANSSAERV